MSIAPPHTKRHVVICTDGVFPHAMGGMQRHTRLLTEHLARSGEVSITVIHPHEVKVFDPSLRINEVSVTPIDTERFYLRELWRYSARVADVLNGLKAEVILSQGFCVWKDIARYRDRLVVHPHGLEMFQGITAKERLFGSPFRKVLRYMVRRSAVVISLGGKLSGILTKLTNGSGCEVVTLPNAVDAPTDIPAYMEHTGPIRLLFVGRFAFNKGLDVLMAVARRLEAEGRGDAFLFQLAGDGPLLASIKEAGVPSNVQLLGRVDDPTLFQVYGDCDAFVLPTRFEGMPTVVLEAMVRQRPIIVSDVGASGELVDATNGHLLPPGDPEALYKAVIAFGATPFAARRILGEASYTRVMERFTWPSVTQAFLVLFARVGEKTQRE